MRIGLPEDHWTICRSAGRTFVGRTAFSCLIGGPKASRSVELDRTNPPVQNCSMNSNSSGAKTSIRGEPSTNRGRVDIIRQTAGRGGKTVTVVANFVGIGLSEKQKLAKEMQKACGCGGTVKEGRIEIQGDKREEIARILTNAGFRPVFAGG